MIRYLSLFQKKNFNHTMIICILTLLTILIDLSQISSPFALNGDASFYFLVSKFGYHHNANWYELFSIDGLPWLDKPHLPFWLTSVSFYLFGTSSASNIIPGFIFYLIGLIYVYRMSLFLYKDKSISLLSCLIYVTTLGIMKNSTHTLAETYLLGEITPAAYYWLRYNESLKNKHLICGAIFTSLALMTKGPFTLIIIFSGTFSILIFQKKYTELISIKWIKALILSLLFSLPEIIADYLQFGTLGVNWFIFKSQFGRFFNIIPEVHQEHRSLMSIINRVVWFFLPWVFIYLLSLGYVYREFSKISFREKNSSIFLISSFFIMFIIFHVSKFRGGNFSTILFPFASILSAYYINQNPKIFHILKIQNLLMKIIILFLFLNCIAFYCKYPNHPIVIVFSLFIFSLFFLDKFSFFKANLKINSIIYSALVINFLFFGEQLFLNLEYKKFSAGCQIQNILNKLPSESIFSFTPDADIMSQIKNNVLLIHDINQFPKDKTFYVISEQKNLPMLQKKLDHSKIIANNIPNISPKDFIQSFLKKQNKPIKSLTFWVLLKSS